MDWCITYVCVCSVQGACLGITWTHSHCSVAEPHTIKLWVSAPYRSVKLDHRIATCHHESLPTHTTTRSTTTHTPQTTTTTPQTTITHKGKTLHITVYTWSMQSYCYYKNAFSTMVLQWTSFPSTHQWGCAGLSLCCWAGHPWGEKTHHYHLIHRG